MWGSSSCTDTVSTRFICPVGFSAECVAGLPLARLAHAWRRMESLAAGPMSMHNAVSPLPDLGSQHFGAVNVSRKWGENKDRIRGKM